MKRRLINFGISLLVGLIVTSCGKDGGIGPPGEKGVQGEKGENGKDGNIILSGMLDPDIKSGNVGDFYLNLKTSYLFGPKTAGGWGPGFNLKGDKGEPGETGNDGENGSKILSGDGIPNINLGSKGDYYIDKTNLSIYGPKANNWGSPVSLKSDADNKVRMFLFYPTFDKNVINDPVVNSEYSFYGLTRDYSIKSDKNLFMEFYAAILDYDEHVDISFYDWQNVLKTAEFSSIRISLDAHFKDVKIKVLQSNKTINGFYFQINGKVFLNEIPPYNNIPLSNLMVLVKAVEFDQFEKVSKIQKDPKRFLRIKE